MAKIGISLRICTNLAPIFIFLPHSNTDEMKLKKTVCGLMLLLAFATLGKSQTAQTERNENLPIKNVIVMIPDGCSTELLALGRWMNNGLPLALDSHIRGLVRTYCSDSPIGDSAPTGSTYATGHRSQDGFIATYPARSMDSKGTRFNTDTTLAYRPMFTLLEAARLQGKATGMVVTCYFPHATPADFLAHTPKRNQYSRIAKQMVHHPCDLFLGGGSYWIDSSFKVGYNAQKELKERAVFYTKSFAEAQREAEQGNYRLWGLFAPKEMDYEIDRNPQEQPSLEEMTRVAIEALSQQENGFFLMVEGSKIDWGAHNNDLPAALFDFLAFDKAVDAAMDFARKDGQTLVLVMPDHQTGGLSIGNRHLNSGYAQKSAEELFGTIKECKASYEKCVRKLYQECKEELSANNTEDSLSLLQNKIRKALQADFSINESDSGEIIHLAKTILQKGSSQKSVRAFSTVANRHFYMGWNTFGHNGGDVFFASYHPQGKELHGVTDNEEIAPYICDHAGLGNLDSLSRLYYAPITEVFPDAKYQITYRHKQPRDESEDPLYIELSAKKRQTLRIFPNTDRAVLNKKEIVLPGICIYNGKGFYLPTSSAKILQ